MATQKERQERSRNEIFNAAMEEFGNNDYDKVTMECICSRHSISKGMMYHYYSNKDELFLLCVEDTFDALKDYVEGEISSIIHLDAVEAIENYFMLREHFFENYPQRKYIFETAIIHTPKHLSDEIKRLHEPLTQVNRNFLERIVTQIPLRKGLEADKVMRYLESVEQVLQSVIRCYKGSPVSDDIHSVFGYAREILDMALFGVLRQS